MMMILDDTTTTPKNDISTPIIFKYLYLSIAPLI